MLDFGFYNMDCLQGMKEFPDKYFGLAICDPPYGIDITHMTMGVGGGKCPEKNRYQNRGGYCTNPKAYHSFDDEKPPTEEYFKELERVSKHRVIWGGNYFNLGATPCIIVWDKGRRGMAFADCELAWTDFKSSARIFEYKWNGMLQEDMKNKEYRIHPTQKPVRLYEWIINNYAKPDDVILDTHVGSASSLIACHNTHHKFVGFEIDETYYKMAKERLDAEMAQMTLFDLGYNPYQE